MSTQSRFAGRTKHAALCAALETMAKMTSGLINGLDKRRT
jgi:hypothetical protein